jgi:hypothetical protein
MGAGAMGERLQHVDFRVPGLGGRYYPTLDELWSGAEGGRPRHLTIVRAIADLAALIEPHVIGMFLFWEESGERRLYFVYRADGPRSRF